MKVLVSTSLTQGARESDFNYCVDGELVWIQEPCETDMRRMPNGCGCGSAFSGLASHRATTTALVVEAPITLAEYAEAVRSSLSAQGWDPSWATEIATEQTAFADEWVVGEVLERDLDVFRARAKG